MKYYSPGEGLDKSRQEYVWASDSSLQPSRWENKDRDGEALPREELLFKYFDLLDDDEILELFTIYENDFKMFGYSFQFRGLRLNLS